MQEGTENQAKGTKAAAAAFVSPTCVITPKVHDCSSSGDDVDDSNLKLSRKRQAEKGITGNRIKKVKDDFLLLEDILKKNGEEHLYAEIMKLAKYVDDDPPLIFGWENVQEFVAAIIAANGMIPPPPPPPFPLPANLTVRGFKLALLNFVRVPGAAAPFETSVLPCTQTQHGHCIGILALLCTHPWTLHIIAQGGAAILPIAIVCVPVPRYHGVDPALHVFPNNLWR